MGILNNSDIYRNCKTNRGYDSLNMRFSFITCSVRSIFIAHSHVQNDSSSLVDIFTSFVRIN